MTPPHKKRCPTCNILLSTYKSKTCKKHRIVTEKHRQNISKGGKGINTWSKGRILSEETKEKIRIATTGERNHQWKKDRTSLQRYGNANKDRRSSVYRDWRKRVCVRDGWKCKINNQDCKGHIEAHHILGYTAHPEVRYDINNGITLCHFHHPRRRSEEAKLSPYFQSLVIEMN